MHLLLKVVLVAAGFSTLSACAPHQTIHANAPLLGTDPLESLKLSGKQAELARVQSVEVKDQAFTRALEIVTTTAPDADSNAQLISPTLASVKAGDVVMCRFFLRCKESMTGEGFTTFAFEQNHPEFTKAAEIQVSANSNWREVSVPFKAADDYPVGKTQIVFRVGFDRQTIQIGGIEIENLGPTAKLETLPRTQITYAGREADAPWRREALARIEKIRKGDLAVTVTDAAGKPIPNASVHAVLKRHDFGFGTCVTADLLTASTSDAQKYREIVEKYFNLAVFENDMKWPAVYDGVPPKVDQALDWLLQRHIQVRGHNLLWPGGTWLPSQLKPFLDDKEKLRSIINKHITYTVSHFRGKLTQWDVVNEPYANHVLIDKLGKSVMIDWYNLAHEADPDCQLFLNEYGIVDGGATNSEHQGNFYSWIKYLKDSGAPIGGVGIQSHFGSVLTDPARILKVFDRFSEFGLPIESTELSINLDDRQLQAEYMRDYMIAAFSHPNLHGIMLWGFWEKRHWRPQGALYSADWTIRPVGQTWIDLVHHQWQTDVKTTTDARGSQLIRGFFGEYDVTVSAGGKSKTLSAHLPTGGAKLAIVLE